MAAVAFVPSPFCPLMRGPIHTHPGRDILTGQFTFPKHVSSVARDLITRLLTVDRKCGLAAWLVQRKPASMICASSVCGGHYPMALALGRPMLTALPCLRPQPPDGIEERHDRRYAASLFQGYASREWVVLA
jgi:hypothetical protein